MPKYDSPPFYYSSHYPVGAQEPQHGDAKPEPQLIRHEDHRPASPPAMYNPFFTGRSRNPANDEGRTSPIDRLEIIRKIKNGDGRSPRSALDMLDTTDISNKSTPLLPSPDFPGSNNDLQQSPDQNTLGLNISRPRSALHRGDFRSEEPPSSWGYDGQDHHSPSQEWHAPISTSPVVPWHRDFPVTNARQSLVEAVSRSATSVGVPTPARSRALSHASLSTSFTYQPPTSPLVHQANAADIPDFEPPHHDRHRHSSPERTNRRHTYSPSLLHQSRSGLDYSPAVRQGLSSHVASLRRDSTFPYQAHQPRRSIGSFNSLPQSPHVGARRPSICDASSPLHHAPMVGSYEESILRGRMSTTPSKPLNFVAQIGVLGKGECKPNLRCPPHIVVPFPAVFYSYSSMMAVDPEPSPYVGMIDLENSPHKPRVRAGSRKRRRHRSPTDSRAHSRSGSGDETLATPSRKRKNQPTKRSPSPKAPPGGCYRIPQQGQLQIVLKNPNKTAVKLFLVPYDLTDMEPGQKTFIRQRSYSAGPIIDMPLSSRNNYGTDRPEAAISATADPKDRPILRYLIHLHICCPSKNRYYLYQNIRVVFANRVPDGKEKLRSEIQMPEPRYSAYKVGRESGAGLSPAAADPSNRRRSAAYSGHNISGSSLLSSSRSRQSISMDSETYANVDGASPLFVRSFEHTQYRFPSMQRLPTLESRPSSRGMASGDDMDIEGEEDPQSPMAAHAAAQRPAGLRIQRLAAEREETHGERTQVNTTLMFSREASLERPTRARTESLLSRKLKDLEVRSSSGRSNVDDSA